MCVRVWRLKLDRLTEHAGQLPRIVKCRATLITASDDERIPRLRYVVASNMNRLVMLRERNVRYTRTGRRTIA